MNRPPIPTAGDAAPADMAEEDNIRCFARLDRLSHEAEEAARKADAYLRLEAARLRLLRVGSL